MRLAPVLAWAAAATATPPRGFLLVATNLPVQLLRSDADADWRRDELGCVLRDICAQAWVAEMRFNTTKDGHDQMPLRKVLWRYRDVLYDLPATTQCRRCTRRTGRDPCAYLLWHNHRKKREEHKSPRTTACGYHAPPHELVLRHQHHGHASSSSSPEG